MADSFGLKIGLEGEKGVQKSPGGHQPFLQDALLRNEARHLSVR